MLLLGNSPRSDREPADMSEIGITTTLPLLGQPPKPMTYCWKRRRQVNYHSTIQFALGLFPLSVFSERTRKEAICLKLLSWYSGVSRLGTGHVQSQQHLNVRYERPSKRRGRENAWLLFWSGKKSATVAGVKGDHQSPRRGESHFPQECDDSTNSGGRQVKWTVGWGGGKESQCIPLRVFTSLPVSVISFISRWRNLRAVGWMMMTSHCGAAQKHRQLLVPFVRVVMGSYFPFALCSYVNVEQVRGEKESLFTVTTSSDLFHPHIDNVGRIYHFKDKAGISFLSFYCKSSWDLL